jgi:hypothetical protein
MALLSPKLCHDVSIPIQMTIESKSKTGRLSNMNNIERNIYHIQTTFLKKITTCKHYCKTQTDELTLGNLSFWPDFIKNKK